MLLTTPRNILIIFLLTLSYFQPALARAKQLIIGLDGVPYSEFVAARQRGQFEQFNHVSKMVSTYPSISEFAWNQILGFGKIHGYQPTYFDSKANRIVGQALGHWVTNEPPFMPNVLSASSVDPLSFIRNGVSDAQDEINQIRDLTLSDDAPELVVAMVISTDTVMHNKGPKGQRPLIDVIDRGLTELLTKYKTKFGEDLKVFLVSDHGNNLVSGQIVDLKGFLKQEGFHLTSRLKNERDVVAASTGLISMIPLWTADKNKALLAHAIAKFSFTDVATFCESILNQCSIVGFDGELRFEYDLLNQKFKILEVTGQDPVGLVDQGLQPGTWYSRELVFELSNKTRYPNSLFRVYQGHSDSYASDPASVIVSLRPGNEWGGISWVRFLGKLSKRAGTHGGLGLSDTLGLFASNVAEQPEFVEADRVKDFVTNYWTERRFPFVQLFVYPNGDAVIRIDKTQKERTSEAEYTVTTLAAGGAEAKKRTVWKFRTHSPDTEFIKLNNFVKSGFSYAVDIKVESTNGFSKYGQSIRIRKTDFPTYHILL